MKDVLLLSHVVINNYAVSRFDNQTLVFYLAIRQWSEDLKHLNPRTGSPGLKGKHKYAILLKEYCLYRRGSKHHGLLRVGLILV